MVGGTLEGSSWRLNNYGRCIRRQWKWALESSVVE